MSFHDRRTRDMFYFDEVVAQLRHYIKRQRPQSFAMTWNLFISCYTKVKQYGIRKAEVLDIFEFAQRERIERYGSDVMSYNIA